LLSGGAVQSMTFLSKILANRISLLSSTLRSRSVEYKHRLISAMKCDEIALPAIASGEIKLEISRVYPLEDAQSAHEYMAANENIGKIVLTISP